MIFIFDIPKAHGSDMVGFAANGMPMVKRPIRGDALCELFWRRLDCVLGRRSGWTTCRQMEVEVASGKFWGLLETLCNPFNVKDIDPAVTG